MAEQKVLQQVVVPNINPKEFSRKGEAVYERLKDQIEREHYGKFIAIEPESGDYEIADRAIDAFLRLKERHPDKLLYGRRIGFLDRRRW
ncbi:hypothetical protein B0813_002527 [Candidatus Fervidibacteria bacterium JGI MDM2 SSWTFF-3-K9]